MKERIPRLLPCACLLDSVKDTPLFSNTVLLFVSVLFLIGTVFAIFSAYRAGYLNLRDMEKVKYKVIED